VWAIENADGLGHHLALWLLALGEVVLDIPTTATARVRELSRGVRRKNDRIDAAAPRPVSPALQGDARQVYRETTTDSLALLDERRVNLSHSRTRAINQLHALLRELMAGGAPTSLTPLSAPARCADFALAPARIGFGVELAKDLIADVRRLDEQLTANAAKMTALPRRGMAPGCATSTASDRSLAARLLLGRTGPGEQVRLGGGVRELHRHRARPDCQRLIPPGIGSPVTETRS